MSHQHDSKTQSHWRRIRTAIWSASITVALCSGGAMAASAQSSGAPLLDSQHPDAAPMPAPVGHRQPQQKDLPPRVSRDEGAITAGQRTLDRSLDICRGC
jgi:hypothetical protein